MATNDTTTVILLVNTSAVTSQMCFFNDVPTAEDGEPPVDTAPVSLVSGGYRKWEGEEVSGFFATHNGFTTHIQGNAASQPVSTQVGTGYHYPPFVAPPPGQPPYGYNVFNIFKDNDRVVYQDPTLGACATIYYCVSTGQTVPTIPIFVPIP